jgi:hypothetical protein
MRVATLRVISAPDPPAPKEVVEAHYNQVKRNQVSINAKICLNVSNFRCVSACLL